MSDARDYIQNIAPTLNKRFGERLAALRKQQQISQASLAERVGCSRATLANLELGKQNVQLQQLFALANALNTVPMALLPELGEVYTGHGSQADAFINLAKMRLNVLLGVSG